MVVGMEGRVWVQGKERLRDGGNCLRPGTGTGWEAGVGTGLRIGDGVAGIGFGDGDGEWRKEFTIHLRLTPCFNPTA